MHTLRWHAAEWLTGGLHLFVMSVSVQLKSPGIWPYSLAIMTSLCFFGWISAYRRYRTAEDLPTSKIASAAQGYVELHGRAAQAFGKDTRAPFSGKSCCWFRYLVERKEGGGNWQISDMGESTAEFLLIDSTGNCVINPIGAEVLPVDHQIWTNDDQRLSEWRIPERCELYVIGNLSTTAPPRRIFSATTGLRVLHSYQGKLARLVSSKKKFPDANKSVASEIPKSRLGKSISHPSHGETGMWLNRLTKPEDGRIFLIAGSHPSKIARRFLVISWLHLGGVFAFGGGSLALIR